MFLTPDQINQLPLEARASLSALFTAPRASLPSTIPPLDLSAPPPLVPFSYYSPTPSATPTAGPPALAQPLPVLQMGGHSGSQDIARQEDAASAYARTREQKGKLNSHRYHYDDDDDDNDDNDDDDDESNDDDDEDEKGEEKKKMEGMAGCIQPFQSLTPHPTIPRQSSLHGPKGLSAFEWHLRDHRNPTMATPLGASQGGGRMDPKKQNKKTKRDTTCVTDVPVGSAVLPGSLTAPGGIHADLLSIPTLGPHDPLWVRGGPMPVGDTRSVEQTSIGVSSLRDNRSVDPTLISASSSVPIGHLTSIDSKTSAQAEGLLALVEALGGRRDRPSSFNARLLGSLPHLKETSVENYISQVELLYERPEHRVRAARAKLTDECNFILEMETRDGPPPSWEAMKLALLSTRKRSNHAALMEYQQFRQNSNEPILRSWTRFVSMARTADVNESKSMLWNYFRGRLTQEAKLLFRAELADRDPYTALTKIAEAGDVPTYPSRPTILAFHEKESERKQPELLSKCFRCKSTEHKIRDCPIRPLDRSGPGLDRQNKWGGGSDRSQTSAQNGRKDKNRNKKDFRRNKKGRTEDVAIATPLPVAGRNSLTPEVVRAYQPVITSAALMGL